MRGVRPCIVQSIQRLKEDSHPSAHFFLKASFVQCILPCPSSAPLPSLIPRVLSFRVAAICSHIPVRVGPHSPENDSPFNALIAPSVSA
ncbi:hypothetical protein E2C01_034028 [Portunus trituberculatus]|uniref:Uncharacterized protein n=1 Tax=Portunus trituberculatus TaxID=210409 RepID=A0A5B7EZF9_PORTR|nr:hypothetical protein [Portunus trituberculatus]